jgi:hypothetical protein
MQPDWPYPGCATSLPGNPETLHLVAVELYRHNI